MTLQDLKVSSEGLKLLEAARKKSAAEIQDFGRVRSCFYFPGKNQQPESVELRVFIDMIIREFGMDNPFNDRESDYSNFVNLKLFEVLSMQLHRLHPQSYLVATQKEDGEIILILRDHQASEKENIKLTYQNAKMENPVIRMVDIHLSKSDLH